MSDKAGRTEVRAERMRECVYGEGKFTKTDSFVSASDIVDRWQRQSYVCMAKTA